MTFELCVVASEPGTKVTSRVVRGTTAMILVTLPPVLSGSDVTRVKPVTRSFWLITSGRHSRSEVILTLKPEAAARLQTTAASAPGGRFAIMIDGEITSQMLIVAPLQDSELSMAGAFSQNEAKALAKQIKSAI